MDDGRRTVAKVPPPDSDDEDEVEVIQSFCSRPTRSGRIPRAAVRPSTEDSVRQGTSAAAGTSVPDNAVDNTVSDSAVSRCRRSMQSRVYATVGCLSVCLLDSVPDIAVDVQTDNTE